MMSIGDSGDVSACSLCCFYNTNFVVSVIKATQRAYTNHHCNKAEVISNVNAKFYF